MNGASLIWLCDVTVPDKREVFRPEAPKQSDRVVICWDFFFFFSSTENVITLDTFPQCFLRFQLTDLLSEAE